MSELNVSEDPVFILSFLVSVLVKCWLLNGLFCVTHRAVSLLTICGGTIGRYFSLFTPTSPTFFFFKKKTIL